MKNFKTFINIICYSKKLWIVFILIANFQFKFCQIAKTNIHQRIKRNRMESTIQDKIKIPTATEFRTNTNKAKVLVLGETPI